MDDLERLKRETEAKKLKFQGHLYDTVNTVYEVKNTITSDKAKELYKNILINIVIWGSAIIGIGVLYFNSQGK